MAQNYTRQSTLSDGDTITASLFNDEYNQLVNAFTYSSTSASSTGHRHDGSAGQGGNIFKIGDLDFLNKIEVDSTNNRWGFYVEVSSAAVEQIRIQDGAIVPVTTNDIDLGTSSLEFKDLFIDGTAHIDTLDVDANATITGTTTLTGNVTTTNDLSVGGNLTVTGTTTFNGGTITMGDAATDNVVFGADVDSHIIPDDDDTYDLGSTTQQWRNLYIDGTAEIDTLSLDGTTVTSTAAELNILDGATVTTAELNILDGVTATATEINLLDGVTATTAELNILDGVTSTAAELNILDGVTATTAELNILDGVTSTAAELNILDGVTATTAELNIMDGVTATTAELNYVDGVTSAIQTQLDAKAALSGANFTGNIDVTGSVTADGLTVDGDAQVSSSVPVLKFMQSDGTDQNAQLRLNANSFYINQLDDDGSTNRPVALFNLGTGDISFYEDTGTTAKLTWDASAESLNFADSSKAIFGAGSDLQIYHTGTDSRIIDGGTGSLFIGGDSFVDIGNSSLSLTRARFSDSTSALYQQGSIKLATTSTGIDVTGTVTADGLDVNNVKIEADLTATPTNDGANYIFRASGTHPDYAAGDLVIQARSSASRDIYMLTGTTTPVNRFKVDGGGDISFYEDTGTTAKLFWDASAESLGLGSTSPDSGRKLHIEGGDTTVGITLKDTAGTQYGITSDNNSFTIRNDSLSSDRLVIDTSGNVGIGTSSADGTLHVHSGSAGTITAAASANNLVVENNGPVGLSLLFDDAASNAYGNIYWGNETDGSADGRITYFGSTYVTAADRQSMEFRTAGTARMRIDSSGNVGIGTSSPDALMHLSAGSTSTSVIRFESTDTSLVTNQAVGVLEFEQNDATSVVGVPAKIGAYAEDNHGSVGLRFYTGVGNTANEVVRFDHDGIVQIGPSDSTGDRELRFETGSGSASGEDAIINSYRSNADLILKTNDTERVRIDSTGNLRVGIGNTFEPVMQYTNSGRVAGNPGFTFNDDLDTGMYNPGAQGTIAFSNNGSESMRIDSSGNLLVGKSSSGSDAVGFQALSTGKIAATVSGDETARFNRTTSDGDIVEFRKDDTTVGSIGNIEDILYIATDDTTDCGIRFDGDNQEISPCTATGVYSDGNIDLGDANARFKDLYLSGKVHLQYPGNSYYAKVEVDSSTNLILGAGPNGAERARIDSSGNLLVGTTSTTPTTGGVVLYKDSTRGIVRSGTSITTADAVAEWYNSNGKVGQIVTNGSSTSYNTSSDQRLKENIVNAPSASDDIDAIQVRSFDWKADGSHQKYGMVAQELQSVAPEAVSGDADSDDMMGVDYSKLVPMLVKEIQSLRARVAELENS